MKKVTVINNTPHPEMTSAGVWLPAAGTPQSGALEVELDEDDRARLIGRGTVSIIETEAPAAEQAEAQEEQPAGKRAAARKAE